MWRVRRETVWDSSREADAFREDFFRTATVCIAFVLNDGLRFPKVWAEWVLGRREGDRIGALLIVQDNRSILSVPLTTQNASAGPKKRQH